MKKLLSLFIATIMLAASFIAAIPVSAASGFSDVEADRWSAASIDYAVKNGYMNGVGEGLFDPEGSLTRAMVATVLWRREESPVPTVPSGFTDVPAGEWYTDAVAWAKETGVVKGLTETAFGPDEFITREQLATMLFRFSSGAPVSVSERADLTPFSDDEKVSDWADEPLQWAVQAGLIKGTDGNCLAPDGFATREQFAAIIERYDGSFKLKYNTPVLRSHYTEKEYPLVTDADVYVATDGDDSNPGTLDAPLATFAAAIAKVREIKASKTDGDIVVAFKAGDYGPLSVSMTAEDSGTPEQRIVYCKYGDGDVVFNNGLDIAADSFEDITEEEEAFFSDRYVDNIKKTDISSVIEAGVSADSVVIFYDGGLCVKARFPNKYKDGSDQFCNAASYNDDQSLKIILATFLKKLRSYDESVFSTMETYGYIIRGYRKDSFKVAGFDKDTNVLQIANWETSEFGRMRDWMGVDGMGLQLCLTNISKELDFEHEYWIDPDTNVLYAYEPEDIHIPARGTMIDMAGTDDVTFRGLTFRNTAEQFIRGATCHGVTLELCSFSGVSSNRGVIFDDNSFERSMELTVRECDFSLAYGQSLFVNGECVGKDRFMKRTDVIFDNNQVSTSNLVYDVESAVYLLDCCGLSVTHNRFSNTSRGAVSFSHSYDVVIEYNEFTGIMQNSEDGGAVYSHGSTDGWNVSVRYNFFDYMPTAGTGTFGYYVDDDSCGIEICNNLFYDAACPVMIHLGRDNVVHDNVFIHGGASFSVGQRHEIDELGLEGAMKSGGEFRKTMNKWNKVFALIENYPEYRAGIEKWCPEVLKYHLDYDNIDDPYFVMNPVNTVRDNVYFNVRGETDTGGGKYEDIYVILEGNRGYTFEENPMFVNPTLGDYRLQDGADFPDVHFDLIGRY